MSAWPELASAHAGRALAHMLLSLEPLELLMLPQRCIRWLWKFHELEAELSLIIGAWAIWNHSEECGVKDAYSVVDGQPCESAQCIGEDRLPKRPELVKLCQCDDGKSFCTNHAVSFSSTSISVLAASRLIGKLLYTHLPALRVAEGSLPAVLDLLSEIIKSLFDEKDQDSVKSCQSFVSRELITSLGRVFMSLPGDEICTRDGSARTATLRLLSSVVVLMPNACEWNDIFGALHHAVTLLLAKLPAGNYFDRACA